MTQTLLSKPAPLWTPVLLKDLPRSPLPVEVCRWLETVLLGDHPLMVAARDRVRRFAQEPGNLLISGPTGSGKYLVMEALHVLGPRGVRAPVVMPGALDRDVEKLWMQAIGWKKNSWSGAVSDHAGLFKRADGTSLFLDDVQNYTLEAQTMFLRVVDHKRFRPWGADEDETSDFRALVTTNVDLRDPAVFRPDLYARLSRMRIQLPGLDEHLGDVPLFADAVLKRLAGEGKVRRIGGVGMDVLMRPGWRMNYRGLENTILEAAILTDDELISPELLAEQREAQGTPTARAGRTSKGLTREAIQAAIAAAGGHLPTAARRLGRTRQGLYDAMDRLGIPRPTKQIQRAR